MYASWIHTSHTRHVHVSPCLGPHSLVLNMHNAPSSLQAVKTIDASGVTRYPVKAISILKAHGKSAHDSQLIDGYAINLGRAAQVGAAQLQP